MTSFRTAIVRIQSYPVLKVTALLVCLLAFTLFNFPALAQGVMQSYQVDIQVDAGATDRQDKPVDAAVNLTAYLASIPGTLDIQSLQVVEVSSGGAVLDDAVLFQFDPAFDFDPTANAAGNLVFIMDGVTLAGETRFFQLAFDLVGACPDCPAPPLVTNPVSVDSLTYENQLTYQIETPRATYMYHKQGAGLASLIDNDAQDWISFHDIPGSKTAGEYRGIPNLVFTEGSSANSFFHPGFTNGTSQLVSAGPLKVTVRSQAGSPPNSWDVLWEFYPEYARMTVLEAGPSDNGPYWFLYEGTIGGSMDAGDVVVRSDGTQTSSFDYGAVWEDTLDPPSWVYFRDTAASRALYLSEDLGDTSPDSYRPQGQTSGSTPEMTVFGFGRVLNTSPNSLEGRLNGAGRSFTLGFMEDHTVADAEIASAVDPLTVITGDAGTHLSFSPVASSVDCGETVEVDVLVSQVTDLHGFSLYVQLDPNVVAVNGVALGSEIAGACGTPPFMDYQYDPGTGILRVDSTLLGCSWSMTTAQPLITITLSPGTTSGTSTLALTGATLLRDSSNQPIEFTMGSGSLENVCGSSSNESPQATVTSPSYGAVIPLGDPVPLAATATDGDGSVVQVEFLIDGAVVATVTSPPWETVWNGGAAGSHLVVARATDNEGATGASPAVALSIQDPSSPSRVTAGLVALYDFASGAGAMVPDVSGVGSPLDLTIGNPNAVTWLPGGGLSLDTATIVRSAGPATKVINAATSSNAITVEAWLTPASVAQNGPARMVTCSADPGTRNFTLGQGVYNAGDDRYVMRLRTTATSDNGTPETSTARGSLTTDLTHVVYTRATNGAVTIYLDGVLAQSGSTGGTCANWDASYAFALGNELTEDRPWLGSYYLVAVYDRSLSETEIGQNFAAGPQGQPDPTAPVITSTPVTTGTIGQAYVYDVEASGYPAPVFDLAVAPAGMTIDPVTGLVNWTPDVLGDQAVEVTATNSEGTDNQIFTLTVQTAPNQDPSAVVTSPTSGAVYPLGDPVPLTALASDGDGTVVQVDFLIDGAVVATVASPPWQAQWLGGSAGSHLVVARATDNQGATGDSPAVAFSIHDPSGPSRVTAGLVVLYDFATGGGVTVPDVSGVGSPLDLTIANPNAVTWLPGGGLSLDTATIVRSAGPATKVINAATSTNAITVEAWLTPASVAQNGPARMVTCSADPGTRNFTLGQGVYNGGDDRYVMRLRTTATTDNGTPETSTARGSLTTDLTHVIYTRAANGAVTIYLDGILTESGSTGGTCANWDAGYAFALGNELTEDRPWLGSYHLVAVYDRALSGAEIDQNFSAGPQGQPDPTAPVITSTPVTTGTIGQAYVYNVEASGYPAPVFALAAGPTGMTIDPVTGLISWTPDVLGGQTVEVTATNSEGTDNQIFTLTVQSAPNQAPSAVVTSPTAGTVYQLGDPVPLTALASDVDGSVTQVEFLVDGSVVATVSSPPWQAQWIGGGAGSHLVVARATDNQGATGDSPAVAFSINDPSGPSRVTAGLVVLYDFAIGGGVMVPDVSGVGSPLDLTIANPGAVTWLPGGGLSLDTATIVRSAGPASKVINAATSNNAITVEAWLTPASVAQNGPARMVTCSADPGTRNFTLGQGVYNGGDDRYVMRLRTTATTDNGTPETSTARGSLTTDLTHVVYTRAASGAVTIYLDGILAESGSTGGTCANWDVSYAFALGNELTEDRPWLGSYHLVAVYDRALSGAEIDQNFSAGPQGQPDPTAPVITSAPVTTGTIGQAYVYDVEASGYPAPAFELAAAPAGMTIDSVTGLITWTPDVLGDQAVEVTATNSEGTDNQIFTLTVQAAPNQAPTAAVTSPTPGAIYQLGDPVPLAATADDVDGSVVQVEFLVDGAVVATVGSPPWQAQWIGGSAGSHLVVARATDNESATGDSPAVAFSIHDPSGPTRVTAGLVVLYDFATGDGTVVPDVSGVGSPLDLTIGNPGAVTWLPGGGLSLDTATIVRSAGPATKVINAATSTNAITVESWLAPASVSQNGPARMVTCSADPGTRNFTLGQGVYNAGDDRYVMRLRTTATNNNGTPETSTGRGTLTTDLTHVVYTRDASGAVTIYLDGVLARSGIIAGTCSNWDPSYAFALGNELTEDRPWLGSFYLVAVYDRALSPGEIGQNYSAGAQGEPVLSAPTIWSTPIIAATVGQPYVYDVEASGYPAPVFDLAAMPAGMTIDPATGLINWTPAETGDNTVEITATNSEGFDNQFFTLTVFPDNPLQLVVWHGLDQRVGHLGPAQPDFNVLGNVGPVAQISSLTYSVNGGLFQDLSIGPDSRRLAAAGDFNADIPISILQAGPNTVTIRALGVTGQVATLTVNVTRETGSYSLPATIAWSGVGNPQDVGQYVDGQWQYQGDGLRTLRPGYDRIFLIGQEDWQDYEVLVPITINQVYDGTAGLGILMRFTGHIVGGHRNWPDGQPKWGYQPFGGIGWLRWISGPTNDPTMQFHYGDYDAWDNFGPPAAAKADPSPKPFGSAEQTKSFSKAEVALGSTYMMRMRAETQPDAPDGDGVTLYSWKIWESGTSEPSGWNFQVAQESQYALRQGGVALLAHRVDATFGDVQVTEVPGAVLGLASLDKDLMGSEVGPRHFELYQNHPNPFNPMTSIAMDVPRESRVGVRIYDVKGRAVRELYAGVLPQGKHTFTWDGRDDGGRGVAGGVYFLRMESAEFTATRKMTLVR